MHASNSLVLFAGDKKDFFNGGLSQSEQNKGYQEVRYTVATITSKTNIKHLTDIFCLYSSTKLSTLLMMPYRQVSLLLMISAY